ncbi:TD and POZ domain-containing protein 3-like [Argiope bruennichi]|uniref:TD and POZ domain-containing protein 5 n=1 Tax=Argiope bruennichi TaxID=94029 RepID=A0A8T0ED53_ARGBR|nr:TD and POZ domain-containing protein 3-like [Argiope bruennichi]KAF8768075.1 TD and POZ domain-containing protein 5 [Argiope bruennichi]
MANQEINEKNCYSVTWIINHFSYCWQKKDEAIASPIFSIYIPEETKWKLLLFPRGTVYENNIAFFLYREQDCDGAENIEIEYDLESVIADGFILKNREIKHIFCKDSLWGYPSFLNREIVLKKSRMKYLPQDNLTIRCTIKRLDGKPVEIRQIYARTMINVERKSLLWSIQEFSNLTPNEKKQLIIKSASKEELIKIDLFLSGGQCFEEKINLNIYPASKCIKFFALQTCLLKSDKITVDSGKYENLCEYGKSSTFPLTISRNKIMERGDLYLSNDVLFLKLEFAISTGFAFEGVTKIDFGTLSDEATKEVVENWQKRSVEETITENSVDLITDLMSLYKDQSLCDAKLQTKTDVFPAHISILSARSPVFRAMFSTDMKEKMNGLVDVSDFDDKTVRQLLLFLYTNKLEELKWDDALHLYQIADKYEIISLKRRCSLFLKNSLNIQNSCKTLIFSDLLQDEDLKNITQVFILKNAKAIFKSEEWKLLADVNSKLALETALRNWDEE